jgi:hypothetical protein
MRQPGDTFEVPDGKKASWFKPVAVELPPADKGGKKAVA